MTLIVLLAGVACDLRASDNLSSVPTLDDLSADWMEASTVRNPPSVNNFWGGLGTTSNLTAFELLTLPPYSQGALSFAPYSQHIVPPYSQGGVPSLNAANVYMLRRTADYLDAAGDKVRAGELRADAEKIRAAVYFTP